MASFGQIVIGPPGSGKSTFCAGMSDFLTGLGRKVAVINLDPANDSLYYKCAVDISTLITLNDVMENLNLGPNGGLIYCMEYLEKNIDWFEAKLKELSGYYFLFDCPGQVELYTHHTSVRNVVRQLEKRDFRVRETVQVILLFCPGMMLKCILWRFSNLKKTVLLTTWLFSLQDFEKVFNFQDFLREKSALNHVLLSLIVCVRSPTPNFVVGTILKVKFEGWYFVITSERAKILLSSVSYSFWLLDRKTKEIYMWQGW